MDHLLGLVLLIVGLVLPFVIGVNLTLIFFWLSFLFLLRPIKRIPDFGRWGRYGQIGLLAHVGVFSLYNLYFVVAFEDNGSANQVVILISKILSWIAAPASSFFELFVPLPTFLLPDGSVEIHLSYFRTTLTNFSNILIYVVGGTVVGNVISKKRNEPAGSVTEYRQARPEDYDSILRLQSTNYIANLSDEKRKEGFLSAQFTPEQTAAIAEDLGTTVAVVDHELAGFLCAFRREFDTGSPVIARMLESYDRVTFEGKPLSSFNSYIYGPVCIARRHRRRGLLRGLYEAQKNDLAGRFEIGVAFVSRSNEHSLQAHVDGLGMIEVGDFELKSNVYVILAFLVPGAPR